MIIKSISHSNMPFRVMINYMLDDKGHRDNTQDLQIFHNLSGIEAEEIKQEFEDLYTLKPKRKNGLKFYHEVMSFSPKSTPHLSEEILTKIAYTYLSKRSFFGLGYGVLHSSEDHLHFHFLLSANRIDKPERSVRLSKKQFDDLKKEMEEYQCQFPNLEDSLVYTDKKDKDQVKTPSKRETTKLYLADICNQAFESSGSTAQLCESLDQKPDLTVYEYRNKPQGIIHKGKKYRWSTIGLTAEKLSILEKLDRLERLRKEREQGKDDDFTPQPE